MSLKRRVEEMDGSDDEASRHEDLMKALNSDDPDAAWAELNRRFKRHVAEGAGRMAPLARSGSVAAGHRIFMGLGRPGPRWGARGRGLVS